MKLTNQETEKLKGRINKIAKKLLGKGTEVLGIHISDDYPAKKKKLKSRP